MKEVKLKTDTRDKRLLKQNSKSHNMEITYTEYELQERKGWQNKINTRNQHNYSTNKNPFLKYQQVESLWK